MQDNQSFYLYIPKLISTPEENNQFIAALSKEGIKNIEYFTSSYEKYLNLKSTPKLLSKIYESFIEMSNGRKCKIIAHGAGGTNIAYILASLVPELIDSMVLIAPATDVTLRLDNLSSSKPSQEQKKNNSENRKNIIVSFSSLISFYRKLLPLTRQTIANKKITCPIEIFELEQDLFIPKMSVETLRKQIGTLKRFVLVKETPHSFAVCPSVLRIAREIKRFFNAQDQRPRYSPSEKFVSKEI